jgi:hypothetical protein
MRLGTDGTEERKPSPSQTEAGRPPEKKKEKADPSPVLDRGLVGYSFGSWIDWRGGGGSG